MAKWKTNGRVTTCTLPETLIPAVEGVLNDVGVYAEKHMKNSLQKNKSSGRLYDSVTWQTAGAGSIKGANAEDSDVIDKPSAGQVAIGSGARHAPYVELGSSSHISKEGHDQFVKDLKDWYWRTFGESPEAPENYASFNALYEHIVANGTEAKPFALPAFLPATQYMKYRLRQALRMHLERNKGGRK